MQHEQPNAVQKAQGHLKLQRHETPRSTRRASLYTVGPSILNHPCKEQNPLLGNNCYRHPAAAALGHAKLLTSDLVRTVSTAKQHVCVVACEFLCVEAPSACVTIHHP